MRGKHIILSACIMAAVSVKAQIFINTGNPNIDKYKKENPNAEIWNEENFKNEPPRQAEPVKEEPKSTPPQPPAASKPAAAATPTPPQPAAVQTPAPPAKPATPVAEDELPPNAELGKCYARCVIPDVFETKDEEVIDKPASIKIQTIPAKFETVYDTVIITPATKRTVVTPAEFENVTEDVMVTPATTKWVKSKADAACLSANPADCQVLCLVEVPAVYKKVTKKVEVKPAISTEVETPAKFKIVPRKKMVEPERKEEVEVPATYKTIQKKVLVKKGGYQEWREILCGDQLTSQRILQIQKALKAEGYDPGPIDNMFGAKTKEALVKFQQDKGLPVGNLNMETLKALGVQ
jgi:hypothetical protein